MLEMSVCNVGYFGSVSTSYCLRVLNELSANLPSEKFQFHVCGKIVEDGVYINPRIEYHGYLNGAEFSSFCDMIDVFINPRCYSRKFSNYSFPSKIYEYMSYCRPIISTPIPHVSEETARFINFSADFLTDSVSECLIDIEKNYSHHLFLARAQKEYLGGLNVGKKIYNFLEDIS